MVKKKTVFLAGASVRAASMSAQRAGWEPIASDLFGDRDLTDQFPFYPVSCYPDDFSTILRKLATEQGKPIPLIYTGALENYPELLDQLEKDAILLGNSSRVIRNVRDPFKLFHMLSEQSLPAVPIIHERPEIAGERDTEIQWLRKPYRSSGGNRIQFLDSLDLSDIPPGEYYYQKYLDGNSLSAVFLSEPDKVSLLGITRQFTGVEQLNARPFAYCGSAGPIRLRFSAESAIRKIGQLIASRFHLRGLFGIDLVDDGEDVWLIEVNPRYTASVEVLELAYETSFFNWHWNSFAGGASGLEMIPGDPPRELDQLEIRNEVTKVILYAGEDLVFPDKIPLGLPMAQTDGCLKIQQVAIADVPQPGTVIQKGKPVCTFLSTESDFMKWIGPFQKELDLAISHANMAENETREC